MARVKSIAVSLAFLFLPSLLSAFASNNRKAFTKLPRPEDPFAVEDLYIAKNKYDYVIGSDESGVGCIAGPLVCVSCCILDRTQCEPILGIINDCKKLKLSDCRRIHEEVRRLPESAMLYTVAMRSAAEIDAAKSITDACLDGFTESIGTLVDAVSSSLSSNTTTSTTYYSIVDGHRSPHFPTITSRPWKQADTVVYTVALASCVARSIHSDCTANLTYGANPTRQHLAAIDRYGVTDDHRRSCKPVRDRLYARGTRSGDAVDAATTNTPRTTTNPTDSPNIDGGGTSISRKDVLLAIIATATTAAVTEPQIAEAMVRERGMLLPEPGEVEAAVASFVLEDDDNDIVEPLRRLDDTSDSIFYDSPRLVEHIDSTAVEQLTQYHKRVLDAACSKEKAKPVVVLDVGASWTSHLSAPKIENTPYIMGVGMNAEELAVNPALNMWWVQDLNERPFLPASRVTNDSVDVILCQLTIDYLTRPMTVCQELSRVLRERGSVHISISNRLFLQKAVENWTGRDDVEHAEIVASYLMRAGLREVSAVDLSVRKRGGSIVGDPLYVIRGTKMT